MDNNRSTQGGDAPNLQTITPIFGTFVAGGNKDAEGLSVRNAVKVLGNVLFHGMPIPHNPFIVLHKGCKSRLWSFSGYTDSLTVYPYNFQDGLYWLMTQHGFLSLPISILTAATQRLMDELGDESLRKRGN